jgi:cell division protein ZipA
MDKEFFTSLDRDTIRWALLAAGLLIVIGVYAWGRWGRKLIDYLNRPVGFEELGLEPPPKGGPGEEDDELLDGIGYRGRREPTISGRLDDEYDDYEEEELPAEEEAEAGDTETLGAPLLIQFSVVAGQGRVFSGEDLREAFLDLDLTHGEMGIFHRYDSQFREPQFSVASLVKPGSFPADEMDSLDYPGVVLFFQPGSVSDPLAVFDDLADTCHELARRLDGIEWDEKRQPLTGQKIGKLRALLEDAVQAS